MIIIGGYIAASLTAYNIICGMIYRLTDADDVRASANGLEAAIWFIAAMVAFK